MHDHNCLIYRSINKIERRMASSKVGRDTAHNSFSGKYLYIFLHVCLSSASYSVYFKVNVHISVYQSNLILDGSTYEKTENYNSDSGVTKSDTRNTKQRSEFVPLQMIVARNGKKTRDISNYVYIIVLLHCYRNIQFIDQPNSYLILFDSILV